MLDRTLIDPETKSDTVLPSSLELKRYLFVTTTVWGVHDSKSALRTGLSRIFCLSRAKIREYGLELSAKTVTLWIH